jgi:hypothetical protein
LLAALAATAPQFIRGNSCGHDFDFHLVSWLDCLNAWRHGIAYPHWAPSANFGAGEPRFVFYPPLTWMLGAALGFLLPWQFVPIALTFLLLAGTGLATRALARHALAEGPATLAGCAALFSGYTLFCAYERSAFAEMTGGFWIPLLLLLILMDRNPRGSALRRAFDGSAAPLALVIAGAWLSNAPVGVMACYLLAAMTIAVAVLHRSWAPLVRAAVSSVLGLGLAAVYVVPAAWEQGWVNIAQATSDPGEMIENSWLFGRHADPSLDLHDIELHRVSLLAVTMLAVAVVGLLIAWRRGVVREKSRWWIPLALVPVAILFLQLPISLPVWNLLPKLRFLQFPWRWLVALEAPMGIFFAAAAWPRSPAPFWRRRAVAAGCAGLFLAASLFAARSFFQVCDDDDAVAGMMSVYATGAGFEGVDEYAPVGADDSLLVSGLPAACLTASLDAPLGTPSGQIGIAPVWTADNGACEAIISTGKGRAEHLSYTTSFAHSGNLVLRLRSYPAWRVLLNGQPPAKLAQRADGLIAVPVPQGPVDLTVDWTTTPDVWAGRWLSFLSLLLVTCLCLLERRLARRGLS